MGWVSWFVFNPPSKVLPQRFYISDKTEIQFMQPGAFNLTPDITYKFSSAEQKAGSYLSCLYYDLNGDGFPEFYVDEDYGSSYPYREAFRIFDLKTNTTILNFDSPDTSYSYDGISDIDGDGQYELMVRQAPYPDNGHYQYEVYNLGISATGVSSQSSIPPVQFRLEQNYPNPFNPSTTFEYTIIKPTHVRIRLYDDVGREVKTIVDQQMQPGAYKASFDGAKLASGVYFCRMQAGNFTEVRKVVLLK